MDKKIIKLAIIRNNDADPCPFGLDITDGCRCAGESITRMAPIELLGEDATDEEKTAVTKSNKRVFHLHADGTRCKYAGHLVKDKDFVECNFGSNAPGVYNSNGITPSPFYSKVYMDTAYDGLYSYPQGYYSDSNISSNLYYGLTSYQSLNYDNRAKFAAYIQLLNDKFESLHNNEKEILINFAKSFNISPLQKKAEISLIDDKIIKILSIWKKETNAS
jgi:hypothetical protein